MLAMLSLDAATLSESSILPFGNPHNLVPSFQLFAVDAELVPRGCPSVARRDTDGDEAFRVRFQNNRTVFAEVTLNIVGVTFLVDLKVSIDWQNLLADFLR